MAKYIFIELTDGHTGNLIIVNAKKIVFFEQNVANLNGADNYLIVRESKEEIAEKLRDAGILAPKMEEIKGGKKCAADNNPF